MFFFVIVPFWQRTNSRFRSQFFRATSWSEKCSGNNLFDQCGRVFPRCVAITVCALLATPLKKNFGAKNQMETQYSRCYINCQSWPYLSSWLRSHWCCCMSAAKSTWNKNLLYQKCKLYCIESLNKAYKIRISSPRQNENASKCLKVRFGLSTIRTCAPYQVRFPTRWRFFWFYCLISPNSNNGYWWNLLNCSVVLQPKSGSHWEETVNSVGGCCKTAN